MTWEIYLLILIKQQEEEKGTDLQSSGPGFASIIEMRYNRMPVDSSSGRTRAHPLDIAL
jgi:hypothetical protein